MLELLAELVAIHSFSREESSAADYIEGLARSFGFAPQRCGNNVLFELGAGSPRLLFNTHIDTVPPSEGWSGDPWTPRLEGSRLTGLGANDAKGSAIAMLLAARQLQAAGMTGPGTLVVAIVAEEEIGGSGGIISILPDLGTLDAAVFGEPTELAPCLAQRGMLLLRCTAQGQSGHVAHAGSLGLRNAIHLAARDIAELAGLELPPFTSADGQQHRTQAQVTKINGGLSSNQVPDRCNFRVDLRTTPNLDHAHLLEQLRALLDCEVECVSRRYLPVSTDPGEPIARAALAAAGKPAFFSDTVCDWSLVPGVPAVKLGPGESERSHRPDEFLLREELEAAVQVYAELAQNYFKEHAHGR